MDKSINLGSKTIFYTLEYKKVKNINLRIKPDGRITVSANYRVSQKVIEDFLILKSDFILNALVKCENRTQKEKIKYFDDGEIRKVVLDLCDKVYPYFEKMGIKYPEIKFRKMVSRWGSCDFKKRVLTFNTCLIYAPVECIEYVVVHEFTHFLQPNHSEKFYNELAKVCPDYKTYQKMLKEINLR